MTYVSQEDAIRAFVEQDPKVEAARRNLRVAMHEAETLIMKHLGHLDAGVAQGGAVFKHRYIKMAGRPVRVHVTHYTITGDLARVEILLPSQDHLILEQDMTLPDLFAQVGGWITDGPRPVDLA